MHSRLDILQEENSLDQQISPLDSATYIDSSIFGYGDKQILADTWLVRMNETLSYSTVSRGDCVPLTGNLFIRQPGKFQNMIHSIDTHFDYSFQQSSIH